MVGVVFSEHRDLNLVDDAEQIYDEENIKTILRHNIGIDVLREIFSQYYPEASFRVDNDELQELSDTQNTLMFVYPEEESGEVQSSSQNSEEKMIKAIAMHNKTTLKTCLGNNGDVLKSGILIPSIRSTITCEYDVDSTSGPSKTLMGVIIRFREMDDSTASTARCFIRVNIILPNLPGNSLIDIKLTDNDIVKSHHVSSAWIEYFPEKAPSDTLRFVYNKTFVIRTTQPDIATVLEPMGVDTSKCDVTFYYTKNAKKTEVDKSYAEKQPHRFLNIDQAGPEDDQVVPEDAKKAEATTQKRKHGLTARPRIDRIPFLSPFIQKMIRCMDSEIYQRRIELVDNSEYGLGFTKPVVI